ncbi:MAG: SDR family oxidoreductase [Alphaproteobacteria bacterium]|nr:SDR family oxidoreductase [Alphaproteobacteria bacterium]
MDLGLQGKSVIITGGGSNIGRAITLGFAREGANLTVADIAVEQAEQVAEEARKLGASDAQVIQTDVTDFDAVGKMVEAARKKYGRIDVLVNNVGWDRLMFFSKTTPDLWERIIQINFLSVLNCTKQVLDTMIEQKEGAIVSISSDASRQGEPTEAVYGGMKAAVNSFMKTVARENGRFGIRCNVVCPGITVAEKPEELSEQSMWKTRDVDFSEDQLEKIAKVMPLKKIGRPDDIVGAVLYFASNKVAGHATGQVLSVSGGYSMIG